ncbi:MAG TPA: hypothetical protein VFT98_01380 [Myxococcota bacterium]|nr:hypothetical protein [Myxococcota bacterium]
MPISTRGFLQLFAVWLPAALAAAALLARWRDAAPSVAVLTLFGFSAALLLACGLANRFAFFFVPAMVLATARALSELADDARSMQLLRRPAFALPALALIGAVALQGVSRGPALPARLRSARAPAEDMRAAIAFLDRRAAPSDVVYHDFWIPFAPLYYFRPNGTYIEALDPIFLYRFDPHLFAGMLSVHRGEAQDPHRVIAGDFGARFVFVQKTHAERNLARTLARDPRFRLIYNHRFALVFEVTP